MSPVFWRASGLHLLACRPDGRLGVTDDFLRAYLLRPELRPVEESCAGERALHAALMEDPRRPITPVALVALKDPDARENYGLFGRLRDHLVRHGTLEAAYLAQAQAPLDLPSLFLDHMVHAILHGLLSGTPDPYRLRAAECLFRVQRVSVENEGVLLADEDTLELRRGNRPPSLLDLAAQAGGRGPAMTLDVLNEANKHEYFERSDRFDMALDLGFGRPGLDALARVLEAWLGHMLGVEAAIQPTGSVRDERWSWHVGLDKEASALLNRLYAGEALDGAEAENLLALFRLTFEDQDRLLPSMRGKPVYLGMAMDREGRLRMKPQNLLVNLPLRPRD